MTQQQSSPSKLHTNIKVILSLSLITHHPMKIGEWRYSSTALDGGKWPESCPSHFIPRQGAPGTQGLGGWVAPELVWLLWR